MGHGKHIGGPGVDIQVSPTDGGFQVELFGEGQGNPPFGVMNGTPGIGGGSYKENLETGKRTYFSSKGRFYIGENDIWAGTSSGGGGYGDALERDPEAVLESVFDGMLSLECAEDVYGVVINRAMMTIDRAKTEKLRAKMAAERGPLQVTSPSRPGAADWIQRKLRQGDEYLVDAQ